MKVLIDVDSKSCQKTGLV